MIINHTWHIQLESFLDFGLPLNTKQEVQFLCKQYQCKNANKLERKNRANLWTWSQSVIRWRAHSSCKIFSFFSSRDDWAFCLCTSACLLSLLPLPLTAESTLGFAWTDNRRQLPLPSCHLAMLPNQQKNSGQSVTRNPYQAHLFISHKELLSCVPESAGL